jgi:hypothetical protein
VVCDWEGSIHDACILGESLSTGDGLNISDGKFYLEDVGYAW